jgi:predicted membrane-bound spermidine synthase
MGVTLPILAKTFTARIEAASAITGYFYGINTLGAAVGAFVTPWILLRNFGFEDVLRIGAALNAACAIGGLLVWWWLGRGPAIGSEKESVPESPEAVEAGAFSIRVWMLIYALSGFIALALEIVWFRLLAVLQKSTAFTFPSLLAVYLIGLAAGVMIGVPLARRSRRPALLFLALQSGVTLYAGAAFSLLLHHVSRKTYLRPLWTYLGSYEPINAADMAETIPKWLGGETIAAEAWGTTSFGLILYFVLPAILIAPSTLLMGASFPVLQKLVQNNPTFLGRRIGWLQTLNIAGSMLGALIVGWFLLGWLGSSGTFRLLILLGGIFLCLGLWLATSKPWQRYLGLALSVFCVARLAYSLPPSNRLWAKLHGTVPQAIIAREGSSGVAVLKGDLGGFDKSGVWVFTNGMGQSWLPYGSVHTELGLLAIALHPKPVDIAVIGLGSGDTAYALAGSPHTRELVSIEIIEEIHHALREGAPRIRYSPLDSLLNDPRIKWVFTDGRAHILRSGKQFDVIEADALRPNSAYSGNLYSREYFRTLRDRLKPDGLAVSWVPTDRVLASFLDAFPYVIVVRGIAIGGRQPIEIEPATIQARLTDPFTVEHYRRITANVEELTSGLLTGDIQRYTPESPRPSTRDLNSDLFPKDEYMVPPQL